MTLIYTWDDQTWVIICKVITGLELFIRFGLFLKVVHFVENNIWPNCQEQPIFYIIVKISYYDLLGNSKKNNKKEVKMAKCKIKVSHGNLMHSRMRSLLLYILACNPCKCTRFLFIIFCCIFIAFQKYFSFLYNIIKSKSNHTSS